MHFSDFFNMKKSRSQNLKVDREVISGPLQIVDEFARYLFIALHLRNLQKIAKIVLRV